MKKNIHPAYNTKAKVTCACKHSFHTGSTVDDIHIEICSKCHPFYTGDQKLIDTTGRVEKYKKRTEAHAKIQKTVKPKKERKKREKK